MARMSKSEHQFVLPAQAFVPIKDTFSASHKEAKRKEIDKLMHQQSKMEEKLKELEASNQHLLSEMSNLKKLRENPHLDGQAEHALRNATDMTLYLTKKLQNMHEAITKIEVRLQQQEKTIQEERGGLAALADKVVEIEANSVLNCEEKLSKQSIELSGLKDSIQDLRKRVSDEQIERKSNEHKMIDRLNKQREDLASSRQLSAMPLQSNAMNVKLEERIVHLEDEITKRQTINDMKQQKDHTSEIERIKEDIDKLRKELESDAKRFDYRQKLTEFKKEWDEELSNFLQSIKTERLKMNQEMKVVKESLAVVADKQVDHHKSMQEKLQAEILTRQQFECDTLRQMTLLDDKVIKIGSSFGLTSMKGISSGKSDMLIKEVDSLKRLIVDIEKNLEQKMENSISKLRHPTQLDNHTRESTDAWKEAIDKNLRELKTDFYAMKANQDNLTHAEFRKRMLKLEETVEDYKIFKDVSNVAIEELRKGIKYLADQKPKTPLQAKERENKSDGYSSNHEWKEQFDSRLKEIRKNVNVHEEKILQHDDKLNSLKKESENEVTERINAIEGIKELVNKLVRQLPTHDEPRSNSTKEGLKKLANALQGTKNVLALKMQHEMKERENAIEYLTVRLDDLDGTIYGMDGRLIKLENDSKLHIENLQKKQSNEEKEDENHSEGKTEMVSRQKLK